MTASRPILPQTRLQKRIYLLLVGLVSVLTVLGGLAVWLIIIVMEDATLDRFVVRTMNQVVFYRDHSLVAQQSLFIARSPDELTQKHGSAPWPEDPGLHTFFADNQGRSVQFGDSWADRWERWIAHPREREYRLWYEPANDTEPALWIIMDLEFSEFTEQESETITQFFILFLVAIVIGALVSGYIIIRWAISPIQALATRVRNRTQTIDLTFLKGDSRKEDEIAYLEQVVDDYADSLEQALEREKAFISDCSHELRTPITILNGAVALERALDDSDSEKRETVMQRITRSGLRMERLVNTFLILARSQDYRPEISEKWPLKELINDVLDEMQILHPTSEISVRVDIPDTYGCILHRESLFSICHNLINNSFSHLRNGALHVRLVTEKTTAFELHFIDEGVSHGLSSKTGAGIGLSLVRRLCERENWQIEKINSDTGTHYKLQVDG